MSFLGKKTLESPKTNLPAVIIETIVKGVVTADESGEKLPGVSIAIKGTSKGTITNVDGSFQLSVPNAQSILVFSFIGYLPVEVKVGDQKIINVGLKADTKALEEVVVVGFGTQKKKSTQLALYQPLVRKSWYSRRWLTSVTLW